VERFKVDSTAPGYGPVTGCYENGNEPSCSMKAGNLTSWVTISFSKRTPDSLENW